MGPKSPETCVISSKVYAKVLHKANQVVLHFAGLPQSLPLPSCYDSFGSLKSLLPFPCSALVLGSSAFSVSQPLLCMCHLLFADRIFREMFFLFFHPNAFSILSIGQAATVKLRPWIFRENNHLPALQQTIY